MTFRHIVLTVAALAVLGLGVYLFIAVKAPAAAQPSDLVASRAASRAPDSPPRDPPPRDRPDVQSPSARSSRISISTPARPAGTLAPQAAGDAVSPIPPEDLQKIDAIMAEANKSYDRGDFDEAKQIASRVLATDPTNTRMLRIMVSSWCIDGDAAEAQKHYLLLPPPDRRAMSTRCARYGITFTE